MLTYTTEPYTPMEALQFENGQASLEELWGRYDMLSFALEKTATEKINQLDSQETYVFKLVQGQGIVAQRKEDNTSVLYGICHLYKFLPNRKRRLLKTKSVASLNS